MLAEWSRLETGSNFGIGSGLDQFDSGTIEKYASP